MYIVSLSGDDGTEFRHESIDEAVRIAGEELADWYALGQGDQIFSLVIQNEEDPTALPELVDIRVTAEIKVDWL